jgi:hypothetical protein
LGEPDFGRRSCIQSPYRLAAALRISLADSRPLDGGPSESARQLLLKMILVNSMTGICRSGKSKGGSPQRGRGVVSGDRKNAGLVTLTSLRA